MKKALLFFVCLILSIGMALAQKTTFSGIVISAEDGQPIIGALVLAKGEKGAMVRSSSRLVAVKVAVAKVQAHRRL